LEYEPGLIEQVGSWLAAGHYVTVACDALGVAASSYYAWLERGEASLAEQERRMSEWGGRGEAPTYPTEKARLYAEFAATVKKASPQGEERALRVIRDAFEDNWQAAGWYLERRWPKRWGRYDRVESVEGTGGSSELAEAALRDERVRGLVDDLLESLSEPSG